MSSRAKSSTKTANAVSQAVNDSDSMAPLRKKLKVCDQEVQLYVAALELENLKMQHLIAKLQAENMTLNNRVKVLLKEKTERESRESPTFIKVDMNAFRNSEHK
jgi:hypothetical protein